MRNHTRKQKYIKKYIVRHNGGENEPCPICYEPILDEEKKYTHTPCHKSFHSECINEWCIDKNACTCPMCRGDIDDIQFTKLEKELRKSIKLEKELRKSIKDCEEHYNNLVYKYNKLAKECEDNDKWWKEEDLKKVAAHNRLADECDSIKLHYSKLLKDFNNLVHKYNYLLETCNYS